ncbi:MAG: GDP-mannose 4,6-dehydratase [Bacteroidia bacterium]
MKNKYVFSGGGFFLRCSENHKIIYQSKTSLSKGSWSKYKITTAKEFFNLINSVNTPYVYRLAHFANYDKKDNETISDNELYLIGVIASKGYLSAQTFDKGAVLSISQSKITNDKIHLKIINILNSMNLTYSVQNRNDGVTEWKFNSESTIKLLSLFDNENIHTLPNLIYTLSSRQANILFNALMDCDGCWGTSLYSSKRYLLVVQLQTIAAIAGYRTKQIKYTKNKTNKVYTICSITKSKQHQYIQSAIIEQQTEESEIWCITTKNNTIITRDNDCISISGNSSAIIKIAEYEKPDDFVIATGEMHSIKEFAEKAFDLVGLDPYKYIIIDPKYYRPAEVDALCGDADKAKKMLGWEPKISFDEIIKEMVDYDLETARKEHLLNNFSNSAQ